MTDIGDWFNTVPFFTRYWLAGTVGLSVIGRFGLINPYYLFLLAEPLKQFQVNTLYINTVLYSIHYCIFIDMATGNCSILLPVNTRNWVSFFDKLLLFV